MQHAVPVVDDSVGEGIERFEFGPAIPHPLAPVGEIGLGQLGGLLPELVELELELVCTGQVTVALPVVGEPLALLGGESAGPLQPEVAGLLELGMGTLLLGPERLQRLVQQLDDV